MYTSNNRKTALLYLIAALAAALFGGVYEQFSHGVYSCFMIYAFAFPLAGGVLPCLLSDGRAAAHPAAANLWGAGIAALTVGALFRGALEIYGTTSPLTDVYWAAGVLLLAAAVLTRLAGRRSENRRKTLPERGTPREERPPSGGDYESACGA